MGFFLFFISLFRSLLLLVSILINNCLIMMLNYQLFEWSSGKPLPLLPWAPSVGKCFFSRVPCNLREEHEGRCLPGSCPHRRNWLVSCRFVSEAEFSSLALPNAASLAYLHGLGIVSRVTQHIFLFPVKVHRSLVWSLSPPSVPYPCQHWEPD